MLENATLVIRNGKVESVSAGGAGPQGAVPVELNGKHIYPSFIEVYGSYGMPEVKEGRGSWNSPPQLESETEGAYAWNQGPAPGNGRLGPVHRRCQGSQDPAGGLASVPYPPTTPTASAAVRPP